MNLINTHPIKKSDLGFHGNLFGINLVYAKNSGINSKIRSGARVFKFSLNADDKFETYIINDDLSIDN